MKFTILAFDTIDSTNSEAIRQARLGAPEGLCIRAGEQTSGRGRHGRVWSSPKGAGLYFSVILRPMIEMKFLPLITLTSGIAVYETLSQTGLKPDIKWVNDVLVGEKKVSGILAESVDTEKGMAVVVGIGINVLPGAVPLELKETAVSIGDHLPGAADEIALTEILTAHLSHFYAALQEPDGPSRIIDEWRKRSTYYAGKQVRVILEDEIVTGVTDGLESNGALRVRREDGTVAIIQAGDVQQLRTA